MRCTRCERENGAGARFCEGCGGPLERHCAGCGAGLSETARFCNQCGQPADAASAPRAETTQGERRQLTVMFCDLVGSTELSQRLDPEELRDVLATYQDACSQAVKQFDGHVAQYLGDGVLVYFGFPRAHEDDAERAVRAGLAIQSALGDLRSRRAGPSAEEIAARIGIHTGLVVVSEVGDEARHQPLALGDTLNVAARLQDVAEPGGVVISHTTLRLVAGLFVTRDLGTPELRGVADSIGVHAVDRGSGVRRREYAANALTPLAGRDLELGHIRDRWEEAQEGRGQVIAVSGEAGIGKSRLVAAAHALLAETAHTWLELRCSPYTSGSAFQPVVQLFEGGLGFNDEDTPGVRLEKLEAGLAAVPDLPLEEVVPYLAALLGLPASETFPLPQMSPDLQRERTLRALTAPILAMEAQQPVVMACEDLHWSDPSTLDLLSRLIDQAPTMRVLFLLTFRPNFEPPWTQARSYVSPLALSRLSRKQTEDVVQRVAGGAKLPARVLDEVVSRADGVPLFAEELARSVMDSGMVVESDGRLELRGRVSDLSIPTSLHGSLMARLDRLSAAKQVAQLASTLGRDFSYALVEAVSDLDVPTLRSGLGQLVEAEILYQRGTPPDAIYTFKHALLQDTAYESQLKSRRRELHARTAAVLEERFPQRIAAEPERMARHCAQGGLVQKAIAYYQQAGQQAIARLANAEAVEYFGRALEELGGLPESDERRLLEVGLQLALIPAQTSLRGYSDPDVMATCRRAEELCDAIGSGPQQIGPLVGLAVYHLNRGDLQRASGYARALLAIVEPLGIDPLRVAGHMIQGAAAITAAPVLGACEHLATAVEIASATELPPPVAAFDVDVLSIAHTSQALANMLAGRVEFARELMERGLTRVRELDHVYSLASVLLTGSILQYFLEDPAASQRLADECIDVAGGLGFHTPESSARVFRGWARTSQGDLGGVDELERGIELATESGAMGGIVQIFLTGADTMILADNLERAEELLVRAQSTIELTGERAAFEPQLPMFRAAVLLDSDDGEPAEIERLLIDSIDRWHAFQSPWMELRSLQLLARLTLERRHPTDAATRLSTVLDRFPAHLDTKRLRDSRALLAELGS